VSGLYWVRAGIDKGFKKVILESDSVVVINLIIKNNATMDRNYNFIMQIRRLLDRDWEVQTTHVYREANSAADWLANYG
jgi:ribonuclease HI